MPSKPGGTPFVRRIMRLINPKLVEVDWEDLEKGLEIRFIVRECERGGIVIGPHFEFSDDVVYPITSVYMFTKDSKFPDMKIECFIRVVATGRYYIYVHDGWSLQVAMEESTKYVFSQVVLKSFGVQS